MGARFHHDRARYLHTQARYLVASGEVVPEGTPTETTANQTLSSYAGAIHVMDTLFMGSWQLNGGVRTEMIRSHLDDRLHATVGGDTYAVLLPGLGATKEIGRGVSVLAGVYRGFSPKAPAQGPGVSPEHTWSFESGARFEQNRLRAETIGFFSYYTNFSDQCSDARGCAVDTPILGGRARIYGAEASFDGEVRVAPGVIVPLSLAYTFTKTEFLDPFDALNSQYGHVEPGYEMPYVPAHQVAASAGIETDRVAFDTTATFMDRMREQAGEGESQDGQWTDRALLLDVSLRARIWDRLWAYAQVRNVTDEAAVLSRRPFGARPTAPRWLMVGMSWTL